MIGKWALFRFADAAPIGADRRRKAPIENKIVSIGAYHYSWAPIDANHSPIGAIGAFKPPIGDIYHCSSKNVSDIS